VLSGTRSTSRLDDLSSRLGLDLSHRHIVDLGAGLAALKRNKNVPNCPSRRTGSPARSTSPETNSTDECLRVRGLTWARQPADGPYSPTLFCVLTSRWIGTWHLIDFDWLWSGRKRGLFTGEGPGGEVKSGNCASPEIPNAHLNLLGVHSSVSLPILGDLVY
jgi:hypothetical protein